MVCAFDFITVGLFIPPRRLTAKYSRVASIKGPLRKPLSFLLIKMFGMVAWPMTSFYENDQVKRVYVHCTCLTVWNKAFG